MSNQDAIKKIEAALARTTPTLYTRLTPKDLLAIAAASGDEITHLRAMVSALAGNIIAKRRTEMVGSTAIFEAIEAAAGDSMYGNEDGDTVIDIVGADVIGGAR